MADHPGLSVSPRSALIDEVVDVRVSRCRPHQLVTLVARVDDALRGLWRSQAVFEAGAEGIVDPASARL
jgi:acyl-CoA thioester hydrolase/bile acid acetyltransferase-like protein